MLTIYHVKDWSKYFENHKSRQVDHCSFVCVPNKQSGLGLARILAEPDGAAIYGIWQLIVGALSRQCLPRDGWLSLQGHREDTPWSPGDLALMWRRPVAEIQRALDVLSSPAVGWVECLRSDHEVPSKCPPSDLAVTSRCLEGTEGTEQNGTEQKEQNIGGNSPQPSAAPLPPSSPESGKKKPSKKKLPLDDAPFEAWWKEYPRKAGKEGAKKSWGKLLADGFTIEQLTRCRDRYQQSLVARNVIDENYILQGDSFLGKARRFEEYLADDWTPPKTLNGSKPIQQLKSTVPKRTPEEYDRMIAEFNKRVDKPKNQEVVSG